MTERRDSLKYLFVVGCPRSGTTWVAWLLAQHPATVVSLHTGFFQALADNLTWFERTGGFGNRVIGAAVEDSGSDSQRLSTLQELVEPEELHAACRPLAECLFNGMARTNADARWAVEKTPENLLHAELIRAVLPEASFLHVIRDPRAVFSSMRMAGKQWAFPGDLPSSPVAFARSYWTEYLDAGERLAGRSDRYLEVRYEDLHAGGPGELARIFDWLDLPADRQFCERAIEAGSIDRMRDALPAPRGFFRSGHAEGWRQELSAWHIRAIEHLAGDHMERFGYHCSSPRRRRAPARLRLTDALTHAGQWLVRGPLGGPLKGLFGRARRSAETVRDMMGGT